MSELISQGLLISLIGISLTFAALLLLVLVMVLLLRFFPARASVQEPAAPLAAGAPGPEVEEEERIAAIAAALAYLRGQQGEALTPFPGERATNRTTRSKL